MVRLRERARERGLEAVERRLDHVEHPLAAGARGERQLERAGRRRSTERQTDGPVCTGAAAGDEGVEESRITE